MDVTHAGGVFDFLTSETRSPGLAVFNLRAKAQTLGLGYHLYGGFLPRGSAGGSTEGYFRPGWCRKRLEVVHDCRSMQS